MGSNRRKSLGLTYDIVISMMGVISFLFSYIGISMANLMFNLNLSPDVINVLSIGIFILISWYGLGIIINHRAMGPMGAVKRHFSIVANGDYYVKFKLRMGDDMRHISDYLNDMTEKLIGWEKSSIEELEMIKNQIDDLKTKSQTASNDEIVKEVREFVQKLDEE